MVSSATAYSIPMEVQDLDASKREEREKEGTNSVLFMNLSQKRVDVSHMFLVSSCASLRCGNDCHLRLWLGCEFTTLYNAQNVFHT